MECLCPVCKKPLTIGVSHRVMELADRTTPVTPPGQPGYASIVPLPEILGEILGQGPATKRVEAHYVTLINRFASEFTLLRHTPLEELTQFSPVLGEAIRRVRSNKVIRQAGFDGEFGRILVFHEGEVDELAGQENLFARAKKSVAPPRPAPSRPLVKNSARPAAPAAPQAPNPEQLEAITSEDRLILVTAGPGTGKTQTLVKRIQNLVEARKVPTSNIAAITFTNRAATEIEERLALQNIAGVFVGTFHRFCLEWLRVDRPGLAVAGSDERELLLRQLFPDNSKSELKKYSAALDHYFSEQNCNKTLPPAPPEIRTYLQALAEQNLVDLDGVIPLFLEQLDQDPLFLATLVQRVTHLLVDEFQDVNRAQYDLVCRLARSANLFAIGDPDQAIYGFRGSDPAFFFDYAENRSLPGQTKNIPLTRNYRSGATILTTATTLIRHNSKRRDCVLSAEVKLPGQIEYHQVSTAKAEAELVVQRLEEIMGGVCHFSINSGRGGEQGGERSFADIAILYRLNSQAELLTQALERRGIPAQTVGATPFFKSTGLRTIYYWLQAAAGLATVAEYILLCQGANLPAEALTALELLPASCPNFFQAADRLPLTTMAREKTEELATALLAFQETLHEQELPAALGPSFAAFGGTASAEERQRLLDLAGLFGHNLAAFAAHLRANARDTIYDPRAEAVSLMTLHAAKGLEFPVVFICGMEEGIMPYLPPGREADIEEERRLLYVGMTRAREHLLLTTAQSRSNHGQAVHMAPSRFMQELPGVELTHPTNRRGAKKRLEEKQLSLF